MKKLLAAGETRIHAFSHVWRNRERGPLHSPEFTMLEWYRVGEGYETLMLDTVAFLRLAAQEAGGTVLRFRDRTCDPFVEPERLSVAEAFAMHAEVDLLASIAADGSTDAGRLGVSPYATWPRAQTIWHATSCAYIRLASLLTDPTVVSHGFLF